MVGNGYDAYEQQADESNTIWLGKTVLFEQMPDPETVERVSRRLNDAMDLRARDIFCEPADDDPMVFCMFRIPDDYVELSRLNDIDARLQDAIRHIGNVDAFELSVVDEDDVARALPQVAGPQPTL